MNRVATFPDGGLAPFGFDPYDAGFTADPYTVYRWMLEQAPVGRSDRHDFWTLCRFDDVQQAARDWRTFSNAEGADLDYAAALMYGPGDFLDADPPRHEQLRSVVQHAFAPKAIAQLEQSVREVASDLVDELVESGGGDVVARYALPLPSKIISDLLGIPAADQELLSRLNATASDRVVGEPIIPVSALRAAQELREYLLDLVRIRRARPSDDLIATMVDGRAGDRRLSDTEIVGMCMILYAAGMGTTLAFIGASVMLLALHPAQRALLVREPCRLPQAGEELLRFESPVQNNARTTTKDIHVHGITIPAGARIALLFGAANRDARRWDAPDTLDVTREPKRNLAFGDGIHYCIGAPLARLEGRVAIETLLARAPDYGIGGPIEWIATPLSRELARLEIKI